MKKVFSKAPFFLLLAAVIFVIGKYLYMQPKYTRGEQAPPISGQLLNGESFELADLSGKYVLIDFWGSWCPPCRVENPSLVKFYEKFHNTKFQGANGLEVLSIGIEKQEVRWKNAIERDGLKWKYHILDPATNFRFINSKIAKAYGIKEVPTKYLLNPKSEIIGVNLSFQEMEDILSKQIAGK